MQYWDTRTLDVQPRRPQVLHSEGEGRTIAISLAAGEGLPEHQVHERAWVMVVDGEVEIEADGEVITGGPGLLAIFEPKERHEVRAKRDTRLVLLLGPWPGPGHPGSPG
jgi:quercetin dioxygenase-like cupin family protein